LLQLVPVASIVRHWLCTVNRLAFVPLSEAAVTVSGAEPVLFRVTNATYASSGFATAVMVSVPGLTEAE
jgi:hypothetical protein